MKFFLTAAWISKVFALSAQEAEREGEPVLYFPNPPIPTRTKKNTANTEATKPDQTL